MAPFSGVFFSFLTIYNCGGFSPSLSISLSLSVPCCLPTPLPVCNSQTTPLWHQNIFRKKHPSLCKENPGEETKCLRTVSRVIHPCQIPTSPRSPNGEAEVFVSCSKGMSKAPQSSSAPTVLVPLTVAVKCALSCHFSTRPGAFLCIVKANGPYGFWQHREIYRLHLEESKSLESIAVCTASGCPLCFMGLQVS